MISSEGADPTDRPPGGGRPPGVSPEVTQPGSNEPIEEAEVVEGPLGDVDPGSQQSSEEAVAEAVELARRFEVERDEYLDHLRRLQAEFENYKRRVDTQRNEQRAQAAMDLVRELLPVLDAFDAAVAHGDEVADPLRAQLLQTLEKQGLVALNEPGVAFDPNVHDAVMHEDGEGEALVEEVLRTGYLWNGRVARAAMVKVRG